MGVARPSVQPKRGLWHVAQDTSLVEDKIGSKNSRRPSAILAAVLGFSLGSGARKGKAPNRISAGMTRVIAGAVGESAEGISAAGQSRPARAVVAKPITADLRALFIFVTVQVSNR
jgi:hypothetical protein